MAADELMTVEEVAKVLRLSTKRTYAIVSRWHFKVLVGVGSKPQVRVRRIEFEQWLASGGDRPWSTYVESQNPLTGTPRVEGSTVQSTESQRVFEMTARPQARLVPGSALTKSQLSERFPGLNPSRYQQPLPDSKTTSASPKSARQNSRSSPRKAKG
jgi:hypothetical protein